MDSAYRSGGIGREGVGFEPRTYSIKKDALSIPPVQSDLSVTNVGEQTWRLLPDHMVRRCLLQEEIYR